MKRRSSTLALAALSLFIVFTAANAPVHLDKDLLPFAPDPKIFENNLTVTGNTAPPAPVQEQPVPAADDAGNRK